MTLLEMLKSLDRQNIGSFTFVSQYRVTNVSDLEPMHLWEITKKTFTNQTGLNDIVKENLPILTFHYVNSGFSAGWYSPKTFVKPETVRKMWAHFVNSFHQGNGTKYSSLEVNPKHGYFLHLKNFTRWPDIRDTYAFGEYRTDIPLPSHIRDMALTLNTKVTEALSSIHRLHARSQ